MSFKNIINIIKIMNIRYIIIPDSSVFNNTCILIDNNEIYAYTFMSIKHVNTVTKQIILFMCINNK